MYSWTTRALANFSAAPTIPFSATTFLQERLRRYGQLSAYRDKTFAAFQTDMAGGSYTQNVNASLSAAKGSARRRNTPFSLRAGSSLRAPTAAARRTWP